MVVADRPQPEHFVAQSMLDAENVLAGAFSLQIEETGVNDKALHSIVYRGAHEHYGEKGEDDL
jgi:hypothetical protein